MPKGEFDPSQDFLLHDCGTVFMGEYDKLTAGIYRYGDKGKPKIQINRQKFNKSNDKWAFVKLGRLTYEEFVGVAKAAKEGFEKCRG